MQTQIFATHFASTQPQKGVTSPTQQASLPVKGNLPTKPNQPVSHQSRLLHISKQRSRSSTQVEEPSSFERALSFLSLLHGMTRAGIARDCESLTPHRPGQLNPAGFDPRKNGN